MTTIYTRSKWFISWIMVNLCPLLIGFHSKNEIIVMRCNKHVFVCFWKIVLSEHRYQLSLSVFHFFCCHKQELALIMAGVYIREFKSFLCSIQLAVRIPAIFVIKRAWIECLLTWASPTDSLKNYAMNFFYDDKKMVLSMLWKSMNQKDNIF